MSKKILIAEDETPMATALYFKLQAAGFETHVVSDGEAALAALKESQFDLILLDLLMPKKDGFAVLEELKKMKITTPVIVTSNLGQEEDKKKAEGLGARDYIVKSNTTLMAIIEQVKKVLEM